MKFSRLHQKQEYDDDHYDDKEEEDEKAEPKEECFGMTEKTIYAFRWYSTVASAKRV